MEDNQEVTSSQFNEDYSDLYDEEYEDTFWLDEIIFDFSDM